MFLKVKKFREEKVIATFLPRYDTVKHKILASFTVDQKT